MKNPVYLMLQTMISQSPESSYKRLNPALRSTLANCIEADLPFQRDTFSKIFHDLRGHYWFGDGAGSHVGEHFYSTACSVNHAAAIQSFEAFAERPGVLWEENVRQPERLHVGSQFTWRGHYVTVTSMRRDSLVACTYKDTPCARDGVKIGCSIGSCCERYVVTSSKRYGQTVILRAVPAGQDRGERDVARRFSITYAEIVELRRSAAKRLKTMLAKIHACNPANDAATITKEINAEHFRHFELEEIRAAFGRRKDWLAEAGEREAQAKRIEAWRNGANGVWLDVKETLIRLQGDRVECSTGNSVSKAAAQRVLPVLLDHRKTAGSLSVPLDSYTVKSISARGVTIGCTVIPWPEIDRLVPSLTAKTK